MAHIIFPTAQVGVLNFSINLLHNQQTNTSPYSQISKTIARSQPLWSGTATLRSRGAQGEEQDLNAQILNNFLSSLRGQANTFDLPHPFKQLPERLTISSSTTTNERTVYTYSGSPTVEVGTYGRFGNRTYTVDSDNTLLPDVPIGNGGILSNSGTIRVRLGGLPSGLRVSRGLGAKIYQAFTIDWIEAVV